jgi:hypothetical protein
MSTGVPRWMCAAIQSISSWSIRTQPWEAADPSGFSRLAPSRPWGDAAGVAAEVEQDVGQNGQRHRPWAEESLRVGLGIAFPDRGQPVRGRRDGLADDRQEATDFLAAVLDGDGPRALVDRDPVLGAGQHDVAAGDPDGQDATASILYLRAWLPVLALSGGEHELEHAAADARRLAQDSCAPALGSIADWAVAARLGLIDPKGARASAHAAVATLAEQGEHYNAARLDLDFALLTNGSTRIEIAEDVAQRFEAMGAAASAAFGRTAVTEHSPS